ncbi:MAG: CHASE domain-containing protein [Phycisphaerales bacterium]
MWVTPLLVLAVGLLATAAVAWFLGRTLIAYRRADLQEEAANTREAIEKRIDTYAALLRATAAMFSTGLPVDHDSFRRYARAIDLGDQYPGTLGIGFSLRITPEEVPGVEADIRRTIPSFRIWPPGPRDEYHTIPFLEPLDERNLRAVGYDMFTDERRRAAMERARDTGLPASTAPLRLVQESDDDPAPQPGLVIYAPVYRADPQTVEQRREQLVGFAYAPLRAGDLLAGVLGPGHMPMEIYDGDPDAGGSLLVRGPHPPITRSGELLTHPINVAGRPWTLRFGSPPDLPFVWPYTLAVAGTGAGISLLLFALTRSEARARDAAERTAEDLRASRAALAASEERFRVALKNAPIVVLNIGPDLRVRWVSDLPGGAGPETVVGRPIAELVPPEDAAAALAPLEEALRTGAGSRFEFSLSARGGARTYDVTVEPLRGPRGEVTGLTAAAVDISGRKQAERDLARHARELARSNAELEDFAYVASHDLKEPLRGMANYARFVLEDSGHRLPAEDTARLESITRLSQRLYELLDSLLEYSRVGRGELALAPVDFNRVAAEVLESLRPRLEEEGVAVELRPLPTIRCDAVRAGQVLSNLVVNALKYNDKPRKHVEIGAVGNGRSTVLFVRDNGIGIAPRHHESIFKMFRRLHPRDRYGGGSGAGLAIVQKIVQRHGGRVWVESTPGEGSVFYFTLGHG